MKAKYFVIVFIAVVLYACRQEQSETLLREKTENYFKAWNRHDFNHPDFANFKRDTSYTWHGARAGEGIQSTFNPDSGWKQWDKAWNGQYTYDITTIDVDSLKVIGTFTETTDFLTFIGMPEGYTATVTFWFDEKHRVKETLYAWNGDNQVMKEIIQPIVDWARVNDSTRIHQIYLNEGFIPNTTNAEEWKQLFMGYKEAINQNE